MKRWTQTVQYSTASISWFIILFTATYGEIPALVSLEMDHYNSDSGASWHKVHTDAWTAPSAPLQLCHEWKIHREPWQNPFAAWSYKYLFMC